MEGPAVVTSPPSANPLTSNLSTVNLQLKKDPEDLDDFVLELDEAEINGSHNSAELTDNERVKSDSETSISNESLMISDSALTNHLEIDNSLMHSEKVVNEHENDKKPVGESAIEIKSVDMINEVRANPVSADEPMEVAENLDSVDQELDSLLNAGVEDDEKNVFGNGDINVHKENTSNEIKTEIKDELKEETGGELKKETSDNLKVETSDEFDVNIEIKNEKDEIPFEIKKEDSFETSVDDTPSDSGIAKTEDNKISDAVEENMDVSLNETLINVEKTAEHKPSDFIEENMKKPLNGTIRDEHITENVKSSAVENMDVSCNGIENDSLDISELTNKIIKGISSGEKPSDPEESNGESGKENRNKRLAEVDRKRNAKKIKMSTESVSNGVSGSIANGLHEDSESSREGNVSDNSVEDSMTDSSSDDSIGYIPEKKNVKKRELTKKPPPPSKSFILNKSKSTANSEVYQKSRAAVADSPFKDSRTLTVDGNMMEELVMMKVVEFLTVGSQNEKKPPDNAGIYKKCKIEEDKMLALQKRIHDLTKQVEDCKHIIKKLIEEKVTAQPWTGNVTPLRVTRSVGLQVCTVGSVNVINSRSKDMESVKQLLSANKQEPQDSKDDLIFIGEQPSGSKGRETSAVGSSPASAQIQSVSTPPVPITKGAVSRTSLTSVEKKASETIVTSTAQNRNLKAPNMVKVSPTNTPDSSSGKRDSSGNIILEKKPPPKVSACIDLTDSDDIPTTKPTTQRVAAAGKPTPGSGGIPPRLQSGQFPVDRVGQPFGSSLKSGPNGCKVPNTTIKSPLKTSSSPSVARGNGLSTTPTGISNSSFKSSGMPSPEPTKKDLPKLPATPIYPPEYSKPPRPILRIGKNTTGTSGKQGIMLSWNFPQGENTSEISEYQLYAYQENGPGKTQDSWKKVGDIKALPLPMACFLTQFVEGHTYHFAVRAIDQKKRTGEFSEPGQIILHPSRDKNEDSSEVLSPSSNANSAPDPTTRTKDN